MKDEKPKYAEGGFLHQIQQQSPVYKYDPKSITRKEFMDFFQKWHERDAQERNRIAKMKWDVPSREECEKMTDGLYVLNTPAGEMYLTKAYLLSYHDAMEKLLKKKNKK